MDARFVAKMATGLSLAVLGLAGLRGEVFAQYYPPGPYTPAPPSYRPVPPLPADDDEDVAPLPAPGPYGRPSNTPYPYEAQPRPPGAIQSEALPPPGPAPYGGGTYQDGGLPPPGGRGYSYGNWEPVRPPGDLYAPDDRTLPPGPGRPSDYAIRPPMEITPPPGSLPPGPGYANRPPTEITPNAGSPPPGPGYAALPPDYQPETGQPKELPPQFRRQMVDYQTREPAGTIVIDTPNTYLYLVLGGGKALRYGIGVGREGFTWAGREKVSRMSEWPDWHPPKEMIDRQPYLPRFMAGGESNPLGARALYLGNTLYRIHGTNQPSTIGSFVSSGCIRLTNGDIEDLYSRVTVGTRVVVLPGGKQSASTTGSIR
jgi:lipoprotein-anchoring transpeptidase ErfK/SrfK